jgi:hypothetical protein
MRKLRPERMVAGATFNARELAANYALVFCEPRTTALHAPGSAEVVAKPLWPLRRAGSA